MYKDIGAAKWKKKVKKQYVGSLNFYRKDSGKDYGICK